MLQPISVSCLNDVTEITKDKTVDVCSPTAKIMGIRLTDCWERN